MESQSNGSISGLQDLKIELTKMLEGVEVPEESGVNKHCIYRVPKNIRAANPEAYTPQAISIGPFHHKPRGSGGDLEPMEELKLKYLKVFLDRTQLCLGDFFLKVEPKEWEKEIRSCYAGPVNYNSNDFLKMVITDACFIIEHFLRDHTPTEWKEDPLLLKPWLQSVIGKDLILLENQLPFFVLEDIYNFANINRNRNGVRLEKFPSFYEVVSQYFSPMLDINLQNINPLRVKPKHFTDLVRTFWLPSSFDQGLTEEGDAIEHVYSASQLSEAGLVFKVNEQSTCLLDIEYQEGLLIMPCLTVHDSTELYMRNILAFEECHLPYNSDYISQYLCILDFLINTEKDVSILIDKKIIVNWMGDTISVATMVNNLCKNVSMPSLNSKYLSICKSLNRFYKTPRNKYKAIFIHEYFNTPWKIASTIAAVLLLLLTLIQAICSVWTLVKG